MSGINFDTNPWNHEEERRYGNSRRLFSLAQELGYKFDRPADAEAHKKALETYESVKRLSLMQDIAAAEDKLHEINREIGRILLDKETVDITSLTNLETRVARLAALSSHLGDVVDQKSTITSRLQQPYSGENLLIDASLHKNVIEFFTMIAPLLTDLNGLLETINWTSSGAKDFTKTTNQVLIKLNKSMNEIRQKVERSKKLREAIASMSEAAVTD